MGKCLVEWCCLFTLAFFLCLCWGRLMNTWMEPRQVVGRKRYIMSGVLDCPARPLGLHFYVWGAFSAPCV